MKEQAVPVFYDEKVLASSQYATALQGIKAKASRYGQHVQLIPAEETESVDYSSLPEAVVLLSVSMPLIENTVAAMRQHNRVVVLSGIDCEQFGPAVSCATPSRRAETQQLVNYLYNCGKKRIALVGFGANSINDTFRYHAAFTAAAAWGIMLSDRDVWRWQRDPAESFSGFFEAHERYDAIICPNDVISICLINECKKHGVRVPEDLYLASFGHMSVGSYFRPSITSASMDMLNVGEQTYNVWRFLMSSDNPDKTSLKITVPSRIMVGESTAGQQPVFGQPPASPTLNADQFYYNPVISELVGLDYCISQRDELDMRIIKAIVDKENYESIGEKNYISSSALRYRLNKIFADAGVNSRVEFEDLIHTHLGDGNPFSFVDEYTA